MKRFFITSATILALVAFLTNSAVSGPSVDARKTASEQFSTAYPQVQLYHTGTQITHIYGHVFGTGSSPEDAAEQFRQQYAPILGVDPSELHPTSFVISSGNTQGVMYENGRYKFTLVYYSQYKDGIPVYKADLRLLVRNEAGYPLVLASSAIKDLGDFSVDASKASIDPRSAQATFAIKNPQYIKFGEPRQVIWAGTDEAVTPAFGIEFMADDGNDPTVLRDRVIIDPITAEIIYQESMVTDVNVTGQVTGLGTQGFLAEQCGSEISRPLPYATASIIGGNSAYADSNGNFTITNSGSTAVTVWSRVKGHWFIANNQQGASDSLAMSVTPPGPANFVHNAANTEYKRAEVNAYLHANIVRDFTLHYNPTYPTIYSQTNFPLHCNDNTGYCPGNAWYDGISLTFCLASSPYPNTAFSTVVHHEYGHHLVECAGSGQDQYGEGMGDVMGLLITDDPGTGYGFFGSCSEPLRSADNTLQYPCSGEVHACAPLMSGCVWSIRNQLIVSNPTTYMNILANLAINAMLVHTGGTITPQIAIDYLTLDDDDGNIDNGTPHHSEICTGFSAHNMDCPALILMTFSYPYGRPTYINPTGGSTMRVVVTGVGATPQPNSGILHYNGGTSWQTVNMTQVSPNNYDAVFPSFTCGSSVKYYVSAQTTGLVTVNDPETAPTAYYTTISGTSDRDTLFNDNFATDQGWTGLGGNGEWTIGVAVGGTGNQESTNHGGPDPSTDHSPTTDNKVLGVDLTSGTGGDYSASLGSTYYVTSPVYNCSGKYGVVLSFWRWLGVEQNSYDHAYFQVYSGSSWITLFENGGTTIDESAWSQFSYDVSAYANNNASFQIRFGIGTTDGSWQYCGWNIDDLMITALRCITVPNGTLAGTVTDSQGAVNLAYVHAVGGTSSLWDTTSTSGAYSISAPPGTYSVTFTQVDHRDTTIAGQVVTSNNTTTLNVVMQRLLSTVKGKVTKYPSSTTAVPNVRVVVNGAERSDTTDASGNYLMSGITEGTYSMFFTNPDYRDTTLSGVILTPGDSTTRNVQMVQFPGFVSGTVRDTAGTPLQNIFVRINTGALILGESRISHGGDAEDIPVITAVDSMYTNASGYYISRALDAATYNVRFTHTTYRDTTIHSVVVTPADTTVVSPVLKRRNHTPVITSPATAAATEHILFRYTATASDSDGVVPTIAFSLYPAWMTPVGDTIRGIPPNGSGNTSFRIIASDGQLADTQIVAVTVMAVNDPPTITSPAADTATEQQAFQYNATATDPESTPTISFFGYPNWLTTTGSAIFGTPPEGRRDTVFSVVASDSQLADTLVVTLHVITINDAPALSSQSIVTATRGENFDYLATANDPDNDILTFSFRHYDASWLISTPPHLHGVPGMANHDTTFEVIVSDGQLADTMGVYIYVVGGCYYTTGDVNESGTFTGLDVTYAVRYFKGGPDPLMTCDCPPHGVWFVTGDVNGSCSFTGLDVTYMVRYFKGGAEPIPCPDCAPNVILKKSGTSVNPMSQPIENKK